MSRKSKVVAASLVLIPPVAANLLVGGSLGVWWAPSPVWVFALLVFGVPAVVVTVLPVCLFAALSIVVVKTSVRASRAVAALLIASALIVQMLWLFAFTAEGLLRAGAFFVAFVNTTSLLLLSLAILFLAKGWVESEPHRRLASVWCVVFWLAWLSTPWMFEAI